MNKMMCVKGVLKGATALTDSELDKIIKDMAAKKRLAEKQGASPNTLAKDIAEREAIRLRTEAAKQKRNAAENAIKQRVILDQRGNYRSTSEWIETMSSPSNRDAPGAKDAATAKQEAYRGKYVGGFIAALHEAGLTDYVAVRLRDLVNPWRWGKGLLDDNISVELWELTAEGGKPGKTGSAEALKIAKVIHQFQELARADLNRLGAYIGKIPGYIVAQTHDMSRISKAGFDKWRAQAEKTFGNDRTYEKLRLTGDDAKDKAIKDKFWRNIYYELSTGEHFSATGESGFKGAGNMAKKVSQHRTLHPNTAMDWVAYNDQFGSGSLMEAVIGGLERSAKAAGLMEKFGTNPRHQFESLIAAARKWDMEHGIPVDQRTAAGGFTSRLWDVIDGTADIPARVSVARFSAAARTFVGISKLGMAVISSLADIPISAARIRDTHGDNLFSAMMQNVGHRLAQVGDSGKQREMAMLLHVAFDGISKDISGRVTSADAVNFRAMQKASQAFYKLNIMTLFQESGERANAAMHNVKTSMHQDTVFADLPESLRSEMVKHNIGEKEWDIIRQHGRYKYNDEVDMLLGDKLRDMPLDAIDPLIEWPLEAMQTQAAEGLERLKKKANSVDSKLERLIATISAQGELGQTVADLRAMRDHIKEMMRADFETVKAGISDKPFHNMASAVSRFTKRDIAIMDQHAAKFEALQRKIDKAAERAPELSQKMADTGEQLKKVQASFSNAVDALMSGEAKDITAAGKLQARAVKLQQRIESLTASLEATGKNTQDIADLKAMSDYVKTLQDADFRSLVEAQKNKVVNSISGNIRRFAAQEERANAHNRQKIVDAMDRLKKSKQAEPAVLENITKAKELADELQKAITDWPDNLDRQMNRRRELGIQELETKWHAFNIGQVQGGVIRAGAREKAYATQGHQAGTPLGEATRFVMQFKQYPMAFVQQILGRYAEEDRFWSIPGALGRKMAADPSGTGVKVASLIVSITAMGYLSGALKDIAKGRTPRDPTDPRTWGAAFIQGGGAGIYGDYLFARTNRFGGSMLESAIGPGIGTVGEGADILLGGRDAVMSDIFGDGTTEYPDNKAFNYFKNNTPFLNLFYTRAALDYLILYRMQESLSPGSLRRMEKRLKEDNGQEFILPPSQVVQ